MMGPEGVKGKEKDDQNIIPHEIFKLERKLASPYIN